MPVSDSSSSAARAAYLAINADGQDLVLEEDGLLHALEVISKSFAERLTIEIKPSHCYLVTVSIVEREK